MLVFYALLSTLRNLIRTFCTVHKLVAHHLPAVWVVELKKIMWGPVCVCGGGGVIVACRWG